MNTPPNEQWLDLVDGNDQVTGKILLSEVFVNPMKNYRMMYAFIVNSRGKIWIPRRTAHKIIFPSSLDFSLSTHVRSGEDYETAFRRVAKSKLNMDIDTVPWKFLAHLTPPEHGVSAFENIYFVQSDILPEFDRTEFAESHWITPEEIIKKVEIRESVRDDLGTVTKLYIENSWGE